jgi:hypothetical protein
MLGDGPVSWSSKRQSLVTQSTTEAEYVGASQAAREVMWIRGILEELGYSQDSATKIFGDNQSALKLAHNVEYHPRTKHINIRYHFIRDLLGRYHYVRLSSNRRHASRCPHEVTGT